MTLQEIAQSMIVDSALGDLLTSKIRNTVIERNLLGARDKPEIADAFEIAYLKILRDLYSGHQLTERCSWAQPCPHHAKDQWKDLEADLDKIRTVLKPYGNATGTLGDKVVSIITSLESRYARAVDAGYGRQNDSGKNSVAESSSAPASGSIRADDK